MRPRLPVSRRRAQAGEISTAGAKTATGGNVARHAGKETETEKAAPADGLQIKLCAYR